MLTLTVFEILTFVIILFVISYTNTAPMVWWNVNVSTSHHTMVIIIEQLCPFISYNKTLVTVSI